MSRLGWSLVGAACTVVSVVAAKYQRRTVTSPGLTSRCPACRAEYRYAHPSMRLEALGRHQDRCPVVNA